MIKFINLIKYNRKNTVKIQLFVILEDFPIKFCWQMQIIIEVNVLYISCLLHWVSKSTWESSNDDLSPNWHTTCLIEVLKKIWRYKSWFNWLRFLNCVGFRLVFFNDLTTVGNLNILFKHNLEQSLAQGQIRQRFIMRSSWLWHINKLMIKIKNIHINNTYLYIDWWALIRVYAV